ncbi:MAG TPA: GrpB family protein [Acidimicrobiales bacterium]|nr:GrpB family protein [Acidimicrobiales bacterium]
MPLAHRALCKHAVVGLDAADDDLFDRWRARRDAEGVRVDVIDLYELVAAAKGVAPDDLPLEERRHLAARAMEVIWPGFQKVAESKRTGPIELVAYDAAWPARFAAWRARIEATLGPVAERVEHIGSTSVPGLCAKPIVDVMVSVADPDDEPAYVPACEAAGLLLYSRDDEHRFFVDATHERLDVQVHVCVTGGAFERDHLLFRDYLRRHDEARDAYGEMKRGAAARWRDDRQGYTYAKSDLILELMARAEAWATATGWPTRDGGR